MSPTAIIPHVLTSLTTTAVTLTIVLWAQPPGLPTGIVTIDASEAVLRFINAGGKEMPEADYTAEALRYQQFLEAAIDSFAAENSVIVVNGAAVLSGASDITDIVALSALQQVLQTGGVK